jgi:lipid-A-disaccharide synthase
MGRSDVAGAAIMLVAGEPSGDLHAGGLCRALRTAVPGLRLLGVGGPAMVEAGLEPLADISDLSVIGFSEVVRRLPALRRVFGRTAAALENERPAALVLVDFPGFNLRLAARARRAGVPVVYLVPPQVWAWGARRLDRIRASVTLVLAVLPFEPALFRAAGVPVEYVGHPVLDALAAAPSRAEARRQLQIGADELTVGLLPGSRSQEVLRMTPLLGEAARRLAHARPGVRFLVPLAPGVDAGAVRTGLPAGIAARLVAGRTHAAMRAADLLLVTSGTATLEAALLGTPMVVAYRVSRASEAIAALLLRVPWVSLVNLVLGRQAVPELVRRGEATPERLAAEARYLLDTPGALERQREAFREIAAAIGTPGVAARAAELVLEVAGLARRAPARASGAPAAW